MLCAALHALLGMATSWRAALTRSMKSNASLPNAKYLQLATVRPDGRPANRTVVFRGFLDDNTDQLTFVTDSRSQKVQEVSHCPFAEACWYFPITREQYRVSGRLRVVDHACEESALREARVRAWERMSEGGRSQFAWPHPGIPRVEGDGPLAGADSAATSNVAPLPAFCLVVMTVEVVDWLSLKSNRRCAYERAGEGGRDWVMTELNP